MPTFVTRVFGRLVGRAPKPADDAASRPAAPGPPALVASGLLRTWPGRLFALTSVVLALFFVLQYVWGLPPAVDLLRRVAAIAWLGSLTATFVLAVSRNRRAFLWRVRRKLVLSYVFLGVVPVVLVLAFVLAGGVLVYVTVASYVFQEGMSDAMDVIAQNAETMAIEIGRDPSSTQQAAERRYSNLANLYPRLSLAIVALSPEGGRVGRYPLVAAGPWSHGPPPASVPGWLVDSGPFAGILVVPDPEAATEPALLIRASAPTGDGTRMVVVDLPIDAGVIERLRSRTGTTIGPLSVIDCGVDLPRTPAGQSEGIQSLFRETVAFLDCTRWADGQQGSVAVTLAAPVGGIYNRIAAASATGTDATLSGSWEVFLQILVLLGMLFLIVQAAALVMGALLARSITSAVHELAVGTERVQQGDFAHRITIGSRDQLGDLANSFNRMSSSIEHLLLVQREKQRLEGELRIAREIQKSLLPRRPPQVPGLDIADLCEPAREVGGDYYDFFDLGPGRIGLLIADVSGKGTSAALYMAELKGLVLALSHSASSPRQLLIEVNRRLSAHLGERSFITMTYATIDLHTGTLVAARAGHTPLIIASGGESQVIAPDGMIVGLGWDGAVRRFEEVLAEHTHPIRPGDLVVLYTDGITEAMDESGELFGDQALARIVAGQHAMSAAGVRERVLREVMAFVGEAEPHDDMTMIVLKVSGETA